MKKLQTPSEQFLTTCHEALEAARLIPPLDADMPTELDKVVGAVAKAQGRVTDFESVKTVVSESFAGANPSKALAFLRVYLNVKDQAVESFGAGAMTPVAKNAVGVGASAISAFYQQLFAVALGIEAGRSAVQGATSGNGSWKEQTIERFEAVVAGLNDEFIAVGTRVLRERLVGAPALHEASLIESNLNVKNAPSSGGPRV